MMVTDPPYGVAYDTSGQNPPFHRRSDATPMANDDLGRDQEAWWQACFERWRWPGDTYVFAPSGPPMAPLAAAIQAAGVEMHQWLVWAKDRFVLSGAHFHYRHEHIFYGWRSPTSFNGDRNLDSVWECKRPSASPDHPTTKPVELVERAVQASSRPGGIVADPFLGSGTTVLACEKLGRRCFGMEIEPRYVDVAVRRWELYTGGKAELMVADADL